MAGPPGEEADFSANPVDGFPHGHPYTQRIISNSRRIAIGYPRLPSSDRRCAAVAGAVDRHCVKHRVGQRVLGKATWWVVNRGKGSFYCQSRNRDPGRTSRCLFCILNEGESACNKFGGLRAWSNSRYWLENPSLPEVKQVPNVLRRFLSRYPYPASYSGTYYTSADGVYHIR